MDDDVNGDRGVVAVVEVLAAGLRFSRLDVRGGICEAGVFSDRDISSLFVVGDGEGESFETSGSDCGGSFGENWDMMLLISPLASCPSSSSAASNMDEPDSERP